MLLEGNGLVLEYLYHYLTPVLSGVGRSREETAGKLTNLDEILMARACRSPKPINRKKKVSTIGRSFESLRGPDHTTTLLVS